MLGEMTLKCSVLLRKERRFSHRKPADNCEGWEGGKKMASRKFNKNSSKGRALTLKNSEIITYSRVTKERSYCIWHRMGKREPRAATSNEPSLTDGVKPCGD